MEKSPNAPNEETLKHYRRQVDFLRGVLETEKCPESLESVAASQLIPHGAATTSQNILTQQIHQRTRATTTNRLRQDLLSLDQSSESDVRFRSQSTVADITADDFHAQLLSDEQKREKMVEDMIIMAREWKEQSKIANKIIRKDIDNVDRASKVADSNQDNLKVEASRLSEYNKRACNFWIWIMIIFVCFMFMSMVMFIRIFPRRY
ncbi:vesicle transport protein USE1-like isoform X3 [Eriocheir sinensis]|nr:vesicle transport protein USE1-like isoform X3 [Eriocheir sinensis]